MRPRTVPEENGDVSKILYQRYKRVLREANFRVLRLEEMVMGPEYWSPQEEGEESEERRGRSHTTERTFNCAASRSHDDESEVETASSR